MNELILFQDKKVRRAWDENNQKWYFSIVDVIEILSDSPNPRKYWSVLKTRLKKNDSELTTICSQLKMQSADGKFYNTDVANTEGLLRIIQSVPSPKAEPLQETPEKSSKKNQEQKYQQKPITMNCPRHK